MTAAPERDPAVQPERTRMAWRRTTLTCTAVAALGGRQALRSGLSPVDLLMLALIALAWLGFLVAAHRRIRVVDVLRPPAMSPRVAVAVVSCTVALALGGAVVLL